MPLLSPQASAYIASRPGAERPIAEAYAKMETDEFQARMGPLLDKLLAHLESLADTARPWWSRLPKVWIATGTVLGTAIAAASAKLLT